MSFLPALISGGGALAGGIFAGQSGGQGETRMQRTQRKLIDQLIKSLGGDGPYSDLFNFDEDAFKKSFVEPAQARFRNETAPNIQQQYIASGQQRGTGLDDTLTRAGVDLDSLLNQHMMQYQEAAKGRQQSAIGSILGMGAGAQDPRSLGQSALAGAGGYLSSPAFSDLFRQSPPQQQYRGPIDPEVMQRRQLRGFQTSGPEWQWGTH